jgi:hypothetical protein
LARTSGTSSVQPPDAAPPEGLIQRSGTGRRRWAAPAFVGAILVAAFVVAQTCQKEQIRVSKDTAVATANRQIDFTPTRTVVRLLRQGIGSRPYWIVSLSIPRGEDLNTQVFKELAIVRVDANTGKVADVKVQR